MQEIRVVLLLLVRDVLESFRLEGAHAPKGRRQAVPRPEDVCVLVHEGLEARADLVGTYGPGAGQDPVEQPGFLPVDLGHRHAVAPPTLDVRGGLRTREAP